MRLSQGCERSAAARDTRRKKFVCRRRIDELSDVFSLDCVFQKFSFKGTVAAQSADVEPKGEKHLSLTV